MNEEPHLSLVVILLLFLHCSKHLSFVYSNCDEMSDLFKNRKEKMKKAGEGKQQQFFFSLHSLLVVLTVDCTQLIRSPAFHGWSCEVIR